MKSDCGRRRRRGVHDHRSEQERTAPARHRGNGLQNRQPFTVSAVSLEPLSPLPESGFGFHGGERPSGV